MAEVLTRVARSRISEEPTLAQRYGLSVVLRKAYPAVGSRQKARGSRDACLRVHGAGVEKVGWDELPAEIVELVRRRVAEDTLVAAHVLRATSVQVVRVTGSTSLVLEHLVAPGACTTLLMEIAPRAEEVEIQETSESAIIHDSTSAKQERVGETDTASALVLLRIGEGARVRWFGQSIRASGFTVVERIAVLDRDALLDQHSALVAAHAVRENLHVVLAAPGATVRANTLFVGAADHQFDLGVTAVHAAPHTTSDLRAKGVLGGKAQGVTRGLVRIEKQAAGSDGYQRCDALLLSPTAEVDPIPNLEINTNDVRCTHGVTVSRPNPEQLFYLQSRGFSPAAAQDVLVGGFAGTMLRSYPEAQRERLRTSTQNILQEVS